MKLNPAGMLSVRFSLFALLVSLIDSSVARAGTLLVSTGQTFTNDLVRTSVIGTNAASTNQILVASTNGFGTNDWILVIVMQDSEPDMGKNVAGVYEFANIATIQSNKFSLRQPLANSYIGTGKAIQALRVPIYDAVTVQGTLTCSPWNGTNGGVLAVLCRGDLTVATNGLVTADGRGYRGGVGLNSDPVCVRSGQGESTACYSTSGISDGSPRFRGGGGGAGNEGAGGGGAYGSSGQSGGGNYFSDDVKGEGATAFGEAYLANLFLGGGGGGGGGPVGYPLSWSGGNGGRGGGIIVIRARRVQGVGSISSSGTSGGVGVNGGFPTGGGGGGAGGGVYLSAVLVDPHVLLSCTAGNGGVGGDAGIRRAGDGGAGGVGRIRLDELSMTLPSAAPTIGFSTVTASCALNGLQGLDLFGNSIDSDLDGIPDWWETIFGLNPNYSSDATNHPAGDLLPYLQKYGYGLNPLILDTDGDGLSDYEEVYVYFTSPLLADTDGDGMPDGWEVAHGLIPLVNDANGDLDLDGVSNLLEYQNGLDARTADSVGDGKSDYERLFGRSAVQYDYDRNDRLVGADYNHGSNGFAIAYVYDGNGDLVRQKYLSRDANRNGLPDLWEFLNGLTNNTSAYADTDGDGWTDYQEWRADTSPTNASSVPDIYGSAGVTVTAFQVGFTPSNFVMAVGQLDGTGPEEIVIGADGNPGTWTNCICILSQTSTGWSTQRVDIGSVGITSIAIGQPSNSPAPAIYIGTRRAGGTGTVMQVAMTGNGWQTTALSVGNTSQVASVLGVRQGYGDVLAQLAPTNAPDMALFSLSLSSNVWTSQIVDTRTSHRGLGTIASRIGNSSDVALRILDAGGIQYGGAGFRMGSNPTNRTVKALVVAGGGGGGRSGGGGAGGFVYDAAHIVTSQAYPISVGAGGPYQTRGSNSVFDTITALGGGSGDGGNGGSGGGASTTPSTPGLATQGDSGGGTGYGSAGGRGWVSYGGGGGGAGSSGGGDVYGEVFGGDGETNRIAGSISGENISGIYYLSGGGGGWPHGAGGKGGGGQSIDATHGTAGLANTGGGGGCRLNGVSCVDGGSGLAIISYLNSDFSLYTITGGTMTTSGLEAIHTFTSNGTFEIGAPVTVISEPTATNRLLWRGYSIASGLVRSTNSTSVFCSFVDDKNSSGVVDYGDEFVVSEYVVAATNAIPATILRVPLVSSQLSLAYGLASVNSLNSSNEVFFTGEPNGEVYSWMAPNTSTGSLQRQLFSAKYSGKSWHQLAGHRGISTVGEALVGLCVNPASPSSCTLIYWPPETTVWTPQQVIQTPPTTRIMPDPNSGGGCSRVTVKIWDGEGNDSLPVLQFSAGGTNSWTNAAVVKLDGVPYSFAMAGVDVMPTGSVHELLWNSSQDLSPSFNGNVWLRARSVDNSAWGEWSEPVPYHVAVTNDSDADGLPDAWELASGLDPTRSTSTNGAAGDPDDDGVDNLSEYIADTCPTNRESLLEITGITMSGGMLRIDWKGGVMARQYLLVREDLSATSEVWSAIHTGQPPTSISNFVIDASATNQSLFYRIKAERP